MSALSSAMELVRGAGLGNVLRMPSSKFISEHKKLVGVLTHGTRTQRLAEARDQATELKKELKGGAYTIRHDERAGYLVRDGDKVIGTTQTMKEAKALVARERAKAKTAASAEGDEGYSSEVAQAFAPRRRVGRVLAFPVAPVAVAPPVASGYASPPPTERDPYNPPPPPKKGRGISFSRSARVAPERRNAMPPTTERTRRESDVPAAMEREAKSKKRQTLEDRVFRAFEPHLRTERDKEGMRTMIRNSSDKILTSMLKVDFVEGSGNQAAGFIRRMMAETKKKHGGEPYGDADADESYRNPTKPLAPDTTMKKAVAFDYFSMPKESRAMSKHIMEHFFKIRPYRAGEREELNEYELTKLREAERERQRQSRARRRGGALCGGRTPEEVREQLRKAREQLSRLRHALRHPPMPFQGKKDPDRLSLLEDIQATLQVIESLEMELD